MAASVKGHAFQNEAAWIVAQYVQRKRLSSIGYQFDPRDLEDWEAEAYILISAHIDDVESKESKKRAQSRGR